MSSNPHNPTTTESAFQKLVASGQNRPINHQTAAEIRRRFNIGPIGNLLLWLSKTDIHALGICTHQTRQTLSGLGLMVVFTSLLAFSSSLYMLLTTLVSPDSAMRWPISLFLASLYSFGIMIIDREIVGAPSNKTFGILVRLIFAVCIATAISWPVKLKFFEGRIQAEINSMVTERNADKLNKIAGLEKTGEAERQQQRADIQKDIDSWYKEISVLDGEIKKEANIVKCGPICEGYRSQKNALMGKVQQAQDKLQALAKPAPIPPERQAEIDKLEHQVDNDRKISYDFLTKWEALSRIKHKAGSDYWIMSDFILVFFMLLELVPLALKLSLGKTEYHYYIEARSNLNNQKVVSLTNLFMETIQNNPAAVMEVPVEITDIIAAHMEDESSPQPEPDLGHTLVNPGKSTSRKSGPSKSSSHSTGETDEQKGRTGVRDNHDDTILD